MDMIFPPSAARSRQPRPHHRSVGLIAAIVVLWSLSVTRTDRSHDDSAESVRPLLDLQDIATHAAMIGDSTT